MTRGTFTELCNVSGITYGACKPLRPFLRTLLWTRRSASNLSWQLAAPHLHSSGEPCTRAAPASIKNSTLTRPPTSTQGVCADLKTVSHSMCTCSPCRNCRKALEPASLSKICHVEAGSVLIATDCNKGMIRLHVLCSGLCNLLFENWRL